MVFLTVKPSLREASCCSFEVMKGGTGFFFFSFASTDATVKVWRSSDLTTASVSSPLPRSAFLSSNLMRRASNGGGVSPSSNAASVQYSSGLNAWISRSRSTTIRRATDCTRPADRPRRTFSQRSGLIL